MAAQFIGMCCRSRSHVLVNQHCSLLTRTKALLLQAPLHRVGLSCRQSQRCAVEPGLRTIHSCSGFKTDSAGSQDRTLLLVSSKVAQPSGLCERLLGKHAHLPQGRHFNTSQGRRAPPLVLWLAVKTLGKTAAILTGRTLRKRWQSHPKHKHKSTSERLHENRGKIAAGLVGMLGLGVGYYYYHIEYTPLTNRPRFILFNGSQFERIVEEEYQVHCETYKDSFVPVNHQIFGVVSAVVKQLIKGNLDVAQIRNQTWTIHVVDKNIKNAFVLPNGHIFIFTGILEATDNVEQLGTVLAHEMAHVVLSHSAEMASFFEFFDFLMIVVLTALWAFLPNDGIALIAMWFKNKVVQLLLHMPYNRNLEIEADEVGLLLAAKSCFDVRECKAFWEAMEASQVATGEPETVEFLSTHPSHQRRAEYIDTLLPKAIKVREYCNCPALPHKPPVQRATLRNPVPHTVLPAVATAA